MSILKIILSSGAKKRGLFITTIFKLIHPFVRMYQQRCEAEKNAAARGVIMSSSGAIGKSTPTSMPAANSSAPYKKPPQFLKHRMFDASHSRSFRSPYYAKAGPKVTEMEL